MLGVVQKGTLKKGAQENPDEVAALLFFYLEELGQLQKDIKIL